jgi:hypothetical protein
MAAWSKFISLADLKLRNSEKFRAAKEKWHKDPRHHCSEETPPPPRKRSCQDTARNSITRCAAQICTGYCKSAVYLKNSKKPQEDNCWLCRGRNRMTRSHVLLHRRNAKTGNAREEAWVGKDPRSVMVLPSNPRWEKKLLRFLERSGVGRVIDDRVDKKRLGLEGWT